MSILSAKLGFGCIAWPNWLAVKTVLTGYVHLPSLGRLTHSSDRRSEPPWQETRSNFTVLFSLPLTRSAIGTQPFVVVLFLVVPPALSTLWWLWDSKAIVSVPPIPLTLPVIPVPPSISIPAVAVATAAAVAVPVSVALSVSVPMAIPISVAIISAVSVTPVAVLMVVTVAVAPPVLWKRAGLWAGLAAGHRAQGTGAGEAQHGDTVAPHWTTRGLCRHRAQAAGTGPARCAAGLYAELWRVTRRSHKATLILCLKNSH